MRTLEKPNLLAPAEAGEILKTTPETLANWRYSKRVALPYVKLSGRIYYLLEDLLAFIEAGKVRVKLLQ
jgi:Helix-turn-helix domain